VPYRTTRFKDRHEAGVELAGALGHYRDRRPIVLALPRGGAVVAAAVAETLEAPLDLILVRKIGAPMQPELAMGAVVDGTSPIVVRNEDVIRALHVAEAEFDAACRRELGEIERRRHQYLGDRRRADIAGRVVIVIDDGIATGATMRAALRAIRLHNPSMLVLAVPVAPPDAVLALRPEVDDLTCLRIDQELGAIGLFYSDFRQTTDGEVTDILARFPVDESDARSR
jgi:predicted phosphoribosyltransferase